LLGSGHCFRDHVLGVCPELSRFSDAPEGFQRTFEGSSLETIRHMVAAGIGLTVMPVTSLMGNESTESGLLKYVAFKAPAPDRRVALAWRKSFPRMAAIKALTQAIQATQLPGVRMLEINEAVFDEQ